MDDPKETDLKYAINNYFDNMSFYNLYNFDIWMTIIIITLVVIICMFFYVLNTIQYNKTNWESRKCDPLFMPFASIINNSNDSNYSQKNQDECFNRSNYQFAFDAKKPIDSIFKMMTQFFNLIKSKIVEILNFIIYILQIILKLYAAIINKIKGIISEINKTFIQIKGLFGNILAVIVNLYYQFEIIIDSLKYSFFMLSIMLLTTIVLPLVTITAALSILLPTLIALAVTLGPWPVPLVPTFIILGFLAPVIVVVAILFVIILILTILAILFYYILAQFGVNIINNSPGFCTAKAKMKTPNPFDPNSIFN